jgi:hypothetical protein
MRHNSGSGDRYTPGFIASQRVPVHIGSYGAKRDRVLCQNCVRYPSKGRSNVMAYRDILMHIVVAGSR